MELGGLKAIVGDNLEIEVASGKDEIVKVYLIL